MVALSPRRGAHRDAHPQLLSVEIASGSFVVSGIVDGGRATLASYVFVCVSLTWRHSRVDVVLTGTFMFKPAQSKSLPAVSYCLEFLLAVMRRLFRFGFSNVSLTWRHSRLDMVHIGQ